MTDATSTQQPQHLHAESSTRPSLPASLSGDALLQRASEALTHLPPILMWETVVELTARKPWDAKGWISADKPMGWYTTSPDNVYIYSRRTGRVVNGEDWDGTLVEVQLTAPASDTYIIVVHFASGALTMRVKGPWGTKTAHVDDWKGDAVFVDWNATAGESVKFTVTCLGDAPFDPGDPSLNESFAYLTSVQLWRLPPPSGP